MKSIKKLNGFLLVLLCFSSISTGITLSLTQFLPNKISRPSNEEIIADATIIDFDINVDDKIPEEVASLISTPIKNEPIISNLELDLVVSPTKEDEPLIPTSKEGDPSLSSTLKSNIETPLIIYVEIMITIDVGVKIGLGNEKNMTCPSPDWNFNIIRFAFVEYDIISGQVLEDLDVIVQNLVVEWIQTVEEKGVRKQLERRGVILNYDIEILEFPD